MKIRTLWYGLRSNSKTLRKDMIGRVTRKEKAAVAAFLRDSLAMWAKTLFAKNSCFFTGS